MPTQAVEVVVVRALVAVALVAVLCGCNRNGDADRGADAQLSAGLASRFRIAAQEGAILRLDTVGDFDWDRLVFQCPYATKAQTEKVLGFRWDDFPGEMHEGENGFVFVRNRAVVAWARLGRNAGDACGSASSVPPELARSDAIQVRRDEDGFLNLRQLTDNGDDGISGALRRAGAPSL